MKKIIFLTNFLIIVSGSIISLGWKSEFLSQEKLDFRPQDLPLVDQTVSLPKLTARSVIVVDRSSGTILFQKSPQLKLHPASITKIATAITALESYALDEVITVNQPYLVGRVMGLESGERITVKNLVYGLLIHSANDAAFVLAGQDQKRINKFVNRMNNFIVQLGLKNTHFANFDGEDDLNHYSSAFDLAQLARRALLNKVFAQAVRTKSMVVRDVEGKINHQLEATNELLGLIPEIRGIKTGWTPQAGECFIGLINFGNHDLITVVLDSQDRFEDTKRLIFWAKQAVSWLTI